MSTPPRAADGEAPAPGSPSLATARRGSRVAASSVLASGTGPALPDVGSADDSRFFDLSGDSPATDASSMCRRMPRMPLPNPSTEL
ncbi:hypothetical protein [Streptomyces cylindrosporus]|uniref:Uncharacterized protein n=1 Tax=Streptomyces cylindrosporus TaxID=2927583 RepID=A0ABS9Y588_9ACTN|nr:hypothetical protein [Streptomyces cylindrosporus]MCI3272385.1 hypothetical protein [Streptomyces cylindrosporus]